MKVRTVFQPVEEREVSEQEARVLEHHALLFTGTEQELAEHYKAAGLELPSGTKGAAGKSAEPSKTTEQAKGA